MFTSPVRGGTTFAAEQKIKELKTRVSKLDAQKFKISPAKIVQNSILNVSLMKSVKYDLCSKEIEKQSLAGEQFKTVFNMHGIKKSQRLHGRLDKYDVMKYSAKREKLKERLFVGEKILALGERIKKKAAPCKFDKKSVQNFSYLNKSKTFIIRKIRTIDGVKYYGLENSQNYKKLTKSFQRTELFTVRGNFVMRSYFMGDFVMSFYFLKL